ncbi:hypothetical protein F8M41_004948 [Gigaspora margarita]|uniref:Uncharacterized protein n=1 Tax=Gigaspora margarita TaxID=4874 RepID=A0A8H4A788_GIGMA|nr:hypothetical protein F8M41_004948 [Gigaspora margarita]
MPTSSTLSPPSSLLVICDFLSQRKGPFASFIILHHKLKSFLFRWSILTVVQCCQLEDWKPTGRPDSSRAPVVPVRNPTGTDVLTGMYSSNWPA